MHHSYSKDDLNYVGGYKILCKYYSVSEEELEHGMTWHLRILESDFMDAGGWLYLLHTERWKGGELERGVGS